MVAHLLELHQHAQNQSLARHAAFFLLFDGRQRIAHDGFVERGLLFAEVARGYDTKVIRKVIAMRKRDKDDLAEEEAVLEMYKADLGMA